MDNGFNVLNEEGMKKYSTVFFSEKGYKTLYNYTLELAKIYLKDEGYPYKLGTILGIPLFQYAQVIGSKEEMKGRLKGYFQVLGLDKLDVPMGESIFTLEFREDLK
jgi:hypothetical protein